LNIKTISVIGADGTMGSKVTGLLAAFGNARVFLISLNKDLALKGIDAAVKSVKADAIRSRLIPRTFEDLKDCISCSDWVFESVTENMEIKMEVLKRTAAFRRKDTIVTTGTSGFSINALSQSFDEAGRPYFFGTHFFNPPYSLTLCEVIRSKDTDPELFDEMSIYLKNVICRDVIEVSDTPAFLGNRVGFHFLNKALQYAEKYSRDGGIDYIDAILGPFTGRDMTPAATADFVGLDVHRAVVDNIYNNSEDYDHEAFVLPSYVAKLIKEGKLGRKTGEGLFKTVEVDKEQKRHMVYDIETGCLRPLRKYDLPFAEKMVSHLKIGNYDEAIKLLKADLSKEAMICKHFIVSYISYGISTAQTVSPRVTDVDTAMSAGFNWIGPIAFLQALGGFDEVLKMARQVDYDGNIVKQLSSIDKKRITEDAAAFDFRKFMRAKFAF
jgi:3-hydroxyacyl-CoA dehydrogenase